MALTYFTVTGYYDAAAQGLDSYDTSTNPAAQPLSGMVEFVPMVTQGDSLQITSATPPSNTLLAPVRAAIVNGALEPPTGTGSVRLIANTSALNLNGNLVYQVWYPTPLKAPNGELFQLKSFFFQAPTSDVTVDMTALTPVPGQTATGTTLGPVGPQGPIGPTGPPGPTTWSGLSGIPTNLAYTDTAQTLTNKTISGASNTLTSIGNSALTNPSVTIAGNTAALGSAVTQDQITGLSSTGLVKRTGSNALGIASAGTDYMRAHWKNVLDYGADPTGVADSTAAFNAAYAALPAVSGPVQALYGGGWVYAPTGNYKITSTLNFNELRFLRGDGSACTTLTYTGTGPCINASLSSGYNSGVPTGYATPCNFYGFTIDGSSAGTGAVGLQIGNLFNSHGDDVRIQYFQTAGAIGLYFCNYGSSPVAEKMRWTGISTYLNTTNVVFDCGTATAGSGSFDYGVYEFHTKCTTNQNGVTLQNNAILTGCKLSIIGNYATSSATNTGYVIGLDVGTASGKSQIMAADLYVCVECDGTTGNAGHQTVVMGSTSGGYFTGSRPMVFIPTPGGASFQSASIASGSVFTPTISTDPVYGPTSPTFTAPALGTPASGVLTHCTGLPLAGLASGVASTGAAATTLAERDSNGVLFANNVATVALSQATSATPVSLFAASAGIQIFTGTTQNQVVSLPASAGVVGEQWRIINLTTGATVTVNGSSSGTAAVIGAGQTATFTALSTSPTTAANWAVNPPPLTEYNEYIGTVGGSTTTATNAVPANITGALVTLIPPGGAGGSGRVSASGTVACGGGGGGSAAVLYDFFVPPDSFGSTFSVSIPTAPTGGAAQAGTSANGNDGGAGSGLASFTTGSFGLYALGGNSGKGGTTSTGTAGAAQAGPIAGLAGAAASTTGAAGNNGTTGFGGQPGSAGSGGGVAATPAATNGGAGGINAMFTLYTSTAPAGGTTGGTPGTGLAPVAGTAGEGAGGGASSTTANGQSGASATGYGGGGGGGGAALNGFSSGAGGNGGPGYCIIKWLYT